MRYILTLLYFLQLLLPAGLEAAPRDERIKVTAEQFTPREEGVWMTPWIDTSKSFDELIYSWGRALGDGEGIRFYLEVRFEDGTTSDWLYAGYWGDVTDLVEEREIPRFTDGRLDYDQLLVKRPANGFRYKVVSAGTVPLAAAPSMRVIATDNRIAATSPGAPTLAIPPVLDLPLRLQKDSKGERMPDRCQSAAVATAMQFYGKAVNLEDIVAMTNDPEYDLAGIWPRTIGAAIENGFGGYIDRFRDWDDVVRTLTDGNIILCSITMPKGGNYIDPPYRKMSGHIVALAGLSPDGRIVYIVDSALGEANEGYLTPWYREDFEKVWLTTKGGVGMVIEAPPGMVPRYAPALPRLVPRRAYYREARALLRSNADAAEKHAATLRLRLETLEAADRKKAEQELKDLETAIAEGRALAEEFTTLLVEGWKDPLVNRMP